MKFEYHCQYYIIYAAVKRGNSALKMLMTWYSFIIERFDCKIKETLLLEWDSKHEF